jgi:putative nucleotidyltransferase with HDIG domain
MLHATQFLNAVAQTLSALSLYPDGHQSRERALDALYDKLADLLAEDASPVFLFLGDEVAYSDQPLPEMKDWEWSKRLAGIGIQRLEIDQRATRPELEDLLDEILARLNLRAINTAEARQMREQGAIRYGRVGLDDREIDEDQELLTATLSFTLGDEAEAIRWIHEEITGGRELPLVEAESVVRALAVAMQGDQQIMLPLLRLRSYDEYTTTHALNVCVLAMALAEWIGLGAQDVRAFGVAGLLHDLGKVKIPKEVLNKAGKLTPQEREIMNSHPVHGARIIAESEPDLDVAAVVAYEHHIMLNGGGYPALTYPRDCHYGSKLVHVCDVYDALRTRRPYRGAWPADKILAYLEERSGLEFDGTLAHAFTQMVRAWEPRIAVVTEDEMVPLA